MGKIRVYNLGALNLKVSPLLHKDGELIRSLNVERDSVGALRKRSGYITYLGTPNNLTNTSLNNFTLNNGTQFWNYMTTGGTMYYSTQGTGAWTLCGNGTMTAGAVIGQAIQNNTMIIGDGTANTRHTTSGTSFTDTTAAPKSPNWAVFQNRAYAGTGNVLTYSVTNDVTNWSTSGTSDSSSVNIPGAGAINSVFTANDRVVVNKNSQLMSRWDGFSLVQIPTTKGLSSPQSLAAVEDFFFYLNRDGFFAYNGDRPQLISNPIERQIYNEAGLGIIGTTFDNAPAVVHKYKYLASIGTVTDDLTMGTIPNAIAVYDYSYNEWGNWQFANRPYSWLSFKDNMGSQSLIFGGAGGQCFQMAGTATTDAGSTIESLVEGVLTFGSPESDKKFNSIWAITNPGCQAKIQVAVASTFTSGKLNWIDLKSTSDGVMEAHFPAGAQGKLLFWKLYEASRNARWKLYGFTVDADIEDKK